MHTAAPHQLPPEYQRVAFGQLWGRTVNPTDNQNPQTLLLSSSMSIPLAQIPPATGFHFSGATAANVNLQRSASTGSAPAAPAATAPSILDIAIIPAKLAMGAKHGPVPGFHLRVTQADVSQLVTALRKCDLCFEVSLAEFSPSAVLWTHIHAKVTEHLALHNLALPISPSEPSSSSVTDFHTLPWIVVEKGRKAGDGYKLAIAGNLNGHDLTVAYLRSAKAVPNPSGKDRALLLLAAPPPRPISAAAPSVALPVQSLSAAHRPPAASASSTMPGHIPTTPPLQPTVSRIHHRSPQSQLDANPGARSRRRIGSVSQSDIAPLSLMGLATGSSTTLTPTVASLALHGRASSSSTPHNSTPVLPLLHPSMAVDSAESSDSDLPSISDIIAEDAHKRSQVEIPLPSPPSPLHSDLENWFTGNESGRTTEPVPGNVPEFEGTSIASLATAFLDFLVYSHCHPLQWTWADWPLPDGVTKFSVFAVGDYLKQPVRLFRAGPAAGQGVGHAVLVHALQLMTGNAAFWADSVGGYKRPVFLDNGTTNIRRVDTWKAFGALCGMYMVDTGVAPTPVSPFLVLTALLATAALDSGLEFVDPAYTAAVVRPIMQLPVLVGFDSELAATFAPWLMLPWDEPIPQGHLAPARQFIIQVLETNVVEVASSRTAAASQAVHEGWTFQAYFRLLFGDKSSILGLREFIAFREGLAVPVPVLGHDTSVPLLKTITELVDIEDLPLFILAMYDRGISDVTAFIEKHINYHIIRAADNKDSLPPAEFNKRRLAQKLFRLRFNRYLHGRGHPNHPVLSLLKTGRLSAGQFAAEATSSTVRATTLLKAVTDSSMVPVDPYWQIHIGFQVPEDVKQKGAFFKIATCTGNLTVIMTLDLIRMLTHTPASAEEATEFDAVVHQMLYGQHFDVTAFIEKHINYHIMGAADNKDSLPPAKFNKRSAGQFAAEATSSTVRATTLLKAVTDSSMVPVNPYWQIHIGFQVPEDVKQKGAFFKIATCTGNLTVIMTLDLICMLTHTPASVEEVTEFDAVVHQMLYGTAGDYSVL
ncbi:hypothetical protein L226DRAFT_523813 [Lentinus tigrinus ALCF2SS1-7]|uniref:uncharacterized protein n=1 Tax=Lentinus tigrinus ALCF2SS1-7 TaxID=1328758 RepID=UPI0011661567|nr:hypothetical protein L226DRAFT_523813 [Lentinus tigrinus ALCF2SS1-7]